MAQLDRLLEALLDRNAEELILTEGGLPSFRLDGELKPVSQTALNRSQITALLSELADEIQSARIAQGEPTSFVYRLGEEQPILCQFSPSPDSVRACLRPRSAVARSRTAPESATTPVLPVQAANSVPVSAPVPAASPAPAARPLVQTSDGMLLDRFLHQMVEMESSDLHMSADEVPMVRQHGDMMRLPNEATLSPEQTRKILTEIMPERNRAEYESCNDTDFAYEIAGLARFRVNVFTDRKGTGGVLRIIPAKIMTAEELGLPKAVLDLCEIPKGLVLVTGPTGSGKSTTLATMIDYINQRRGDHIITIEDPIEFVHPNRKCLVNQREVGSHTSGFKKALRAALREDPDIVLVGEMRDLETIAIAIETAETGHLVFGTLHTTTACSTVDRVIDQFPADRQAQIRTMLATSLKGVVSQTLLKKRGGGRVAALEILIVNAAISNLIREAKTFQIPSLMQTGKNLGQCLLNEALMNLIKKKIVDPEEAYFKSVDKTGLAGSLRTAGISLKITEAS